MALLAEWGKRLCKFQKNWGQIAQAGVAANRILSSAFFWVAWKKWSKWNKTLPHGASCGVRTMENISPGWEFMDSNLLLPLNIIMQALFCCFWLSVFRSCDKTWGHVMEEQFPSALASRDLCPLSRGLSALGPCWGRAPVCCGGLFTSWWRGSRETGVCLEDLEIRVPRSSVGPCLLLPNFL